MKKIIKEIKNKLLVIVLMVIGLAVFVQFANLTRIGNYVLERVVAISILNAKSSSVDDIDLTDSCHYLPEDEGGLTPQRLIIDSIGLDLPVKTQQLINGTWKVDDYVVNYAQGTSLINPDKGNVGLFGHDRKSAITDIKKVQKGEIITVMTGEYLAYYRVVSANIVEPQAVDIFYPTDEPILTLVTCSGTLSDKRFVLTAALQSIRKLNCNE